MRCVDILGNEAACRCVSVDVIEDCVLVVSVKSGPWSDMVEMYMLKSAGKRNQLLVYVGQLCPVARVLCLHQSSPCLVK